MFSSNTFWIFFKLQKLIAYYWEMAHYKVDLPHVCSMVNDSKDDYLDSGNILGNH